MKSKVQNESQNNDIIVKSSIASQTTKNLNSIKSNKV